jgi:uncharacterized protein (UPF0303 family)
MTDDIPRLPRFTYDDAWRVGAALMEQCRANNLPVTIGIWLGEQRVFHSARPGTSADNDNWLDRKARTVRRFGTSSLAVARRYLDDSSAASFQTFLMTFGLPASDYALAGGAVPILVHDNLVGVIAVSGLTSEQDHELALGALRTAARPSSIECDETAAPSATDVTAGDR